MSLWVNHFLPEPVSSENPDAARTLVLALSSFIQASEVSESLPCRAPRPRQPHRVTAGVREEAEVAAFAPQRCSPGRRLSLKHPHSKGRAAFSRRGVGSRRLSGGSFPHPVLAPAEQTRRVVRPPVSRGTRSLVPLASALSQPHLASEQRTLTGSGVRPQTRCALRTILNYRPFTVLLQQILIQKSSRGACIPSPRLLITVPQLCILTTLQPRGQHVASEFCYRPARPVPRQAPAESVTSATPWRQSARHLNGRQIGSV